jgi:hypothetical protein
MPRKPPLQPPASDALEPPPPDHELPPVPSGRLLLLLGAAAVVGWVIWRAIYA